MKERKEEKKKREGINRVGILASITLQSSSYSTAF